MSTDALSMYRQVATELTSSGAPFEIVQPGDASTRRMVGTGSGIRDIVRNVLERHSDAPMFEFDGIRKSYAEVMAEAARLAAALRARHGIGKGDVVGIVMRNCPQWFVAFYAAQHLGAIAALLNSRAQGRDIAACAEDVGCRLILSDERCAGRLAGTTDVPTLDLDMIDALVAAGGPDDRADPADGEAPAMILFTSGTTGRPKGATISHRNIACATRQLEYMNLLGQTIASRRAGMPLETIQQNARKPAPLLIVPMFHISGVVSMITTMLGGGIMVGIRRWDPALAIELIERNAVTQVTGPSLVMDDLLAQPNGAERMQCVQSFVVAGQASPIGLTERIRAALPRATQAAGWGMTELTGTVASASGPVFIDHPGTVGVPLPLLDIIVRDDAGAPAPTGEIGEIAVRGPTVMQGYWGLPEATREAFAGEWYLTGDLGHFDEHGLLSIVDRAKDMVISAGENIYCAEVERVLAMVQHHHEVALFGVPDERLGERAVAAVVFAESYAGPMDAEQVRAHAKQHLADYKVPTEILFDMGPLPRNVTGKVDKAALRRRYAERFVLS